MILQLRDLGGKLLILYDATESGDFMAQDNEQKVVVPEGWRHGSFCVYVKTRLLLPSIHVLSIVIEGYKALPWHLCHKTAPLTVYIVNCFVFDLEVINLTWK